MTRLLPLRRSSAASVLAALLAASGALGAQVRGDGEQAPGEWRYHHRDLAGTRYSPLDQIDRTNVAKLAIAWSWRTDTAEHEVRNQSTPLVVNGTMYFPSGSRRGVIAVDPSSGTQKWAWSTDEGPRFRVAPRKGAGRGVSYWTDGREERIFVVLPGFELAALDARTGKPRWTYMSRARIDSSPALAGGRVYVGSNDGRRYALELASGKVLWQHDEGAALSASPALASGRIVIGSTGGRLLCFA